MKQKAFFLIKFTVIISLLLMRNTYAQDIHFSQFFEAPLLRNPSLAGLFTGDLRFQTVYRSQWSSVTTPYQTGSFNGEYKLPVGRKEDFLTIGGEILYDKAGSIALSATHVLPAINFHKSLSATGNKYLSLGFMGGVVQRRLDRSKITTDSQFDGYGYNSALADGETFLSPSYTYLDGSTGLSYNSQIGSSNDNNFFIGIAYHHFNKPAKIYFYNNTIDNMDPKWVVSGGLKMSTSFYSGITLQADYVKQGTYREILGGIILSRKLDQEENSDRIINGGIMFRWKDAIIPFAKLEILPLAISVSYDVNISKLRSASNGMGGVEIGLSYVKFLDRYNSSKDSWRCPRF